MAHDIILSGPEMDLPEDLRWSRGDTQDKKALEVGLTQLQKEWATRDGRELPFVQNTGAAVDRPSDGGKSRTAAVSGGSPDHKVRHWKDLRDIHRENLLPGNLYTDPTWYATCSDMSGILKDSKYRIPVVLSCAGCNGCELINGRCPVTGQLIANEIIDTPGTVTRYVDLLIDSGRLPPGVTAASISELEALLRGDGPDREPRVYTGGPPKGSPQAMNAEDAARQLRTAREERERVQRETDESIGDGACNSAVYELARMLYERIPGGVITAEMAKRHDTLTARRAANRLRDIARPEWLYARAVVCPTLYRGDCRAMSEWLRSKGINARSVMSFEKCRDCTYRHTASDTCRLFGLPFHAGALCSDTARAILEELRAAGVVSRVEADRALLDVENEPDRALRMACNAAMSGDPERAGYSGGHRSPRPPSCSDEVGRRIAALPWAQQMIAAGSCTSGLRLTLDKEGLPGDEIVDEALSGLRTVQASTVDDCRSHGYARPQNGLIVGAAKCDGCPYRDALTCSRLARVFIEARVEPSDSVETTPEAAEILRFFAGSGQAEMKVPKELNKKPLDIRLENPGKHMRVDIGDSTPFKLEAQDLVGSDPVSDELRRADLSPRGPNSMPDIRFDDEGGWGLAGFLDN